MRLFISFISFKEFLKDSYLLYEHVFLVAGICHAMSSFEQLVFTVDHLLRTELHVTDLCPKAVRTLWILSIM